MEVGEVSRDFKGESTIVPLLGQSQRSGNDARNVKMEL